MPFLLDFKNAFYPVLKLDTPVSGSRIPALDGLRGMAISLVLLYHCTSFFPVGWIGVDLFFVLSGFLLTGILLRAKESPGYFRNFYFKRALRILPLYYLLLGAAIVLGLSTSAKVPSISYFLFLQNIETVLEGDFPAGTSYLNHLWSLAVEEQVYLALPFLVFFFKREKLLLLLIALVLLAVVVRSSLFYSDNPAFYSFTLARMDSLGMGGIAAVMLLYFKEHLVKLVLPLLYTSGAYVAYCIVAGGPSYANGYLATFGYTAFALFFSCIMIFAISGHRHNVLQQLLLLPLLRALGKYSYGIYIFHWPIFFTFAIPFKLYLMAYFPELASSLLVKLVLGTATFAITKLSYELIEKRFLDLKKNLTTAPKTAEAVA